MEGTAVHHEIGTSEFRPYLNTVVLLTFVEHAELLFVRNIGVDPGLARRTRLSSEGVEKRALNVFLVEKTFCEHASVFLLLLLIVGERAR